MQTVNLLCPARQIFQRFVCSALFFTALSYCVSLPTHADDGAEAIEQLSTYLSEHGMKDVDGQPFAKQSLSA